MRTRPSPTGRLAPALAVVALLTPLGGCSSLPAIAVLTGGSSDTPDESDTSEDTGSEDATKVAVPIQFPPDDPNGRLFFWQIEGGGAFRFYGEQNEDHTVTSLDRVAIDHPETDKNDADFEFSDTTMTLRLPNRGITYEVTELPERDDYGINVRNASSGNTFKTTLNRLQNNANETASTSSVGTQSAAPRSGTAVARTTERTDQAAVAEDSAASVAAATTSEDVQEIKVQSRDGCEIISSGDARANVATDTALNPANLPQPFAEHWRQPPIHLRLSFNAEETAFYETFPLDWLRSDLRVLNEGAHTRVQGLLNPVDPLITAGEKAVKDLDNATNTVSSTGRKALGATLGGLRKASAVGTSVEVGSYIIDLGETTGRTLLWQQYAETSDKFPIKVVANHRWKGKIATGMTKVQNPGLEVAKINLWQSESDEGRPEIVRPEIHPDFPQKGEDYTTSVGVSCASQANLSLEVSVNGTDNYSDSASYSVVSGETYALDVPGAADGVEDTIKWELWSRGEKRDDMTQMVLFGAGYGGD